jgi:recombination protein RecA
MAKKKVVEEVGAVDSGTLDIAWAEVKKKYGGVASWLQDIPEDNNFDFISSGSVSVDVALNGGFVRGRVVEIFGEPASGKSTLAMSTIAEANKLGLVGLYVDAELSLDLRLPVAYGVDKSKFILIKEPLSAEEYFDIVEKMMGSGGVGVVVIDSVTALQPEAEGLGDVGDVHVAQLARFISQEIRRIIKLAYKTNTLVIFINQTRNKMNTYGDSTTTSGGDALRFYSSHRVKVNGGSSKASKIAKSDGTIIGHTMNFQVVKNKIGVPFQTGSINLIYGKGYDKIEEVIDLADQLGIVNRRGSWYDLFSKSYQGKEKLKEALEQDPEERAHLTKEVRDMLSML